MREPTHTKLLTNRSMACSYLPCSCDLHVLVTFRMSAGDPSSIQAQAIASSSVIACPSAHAVSNAASSDCDGRIPMGHLRTLLLPGTKADAKEVVEDPQRSRVDQLAIASLGMVEVKGDGIVEHTGRIASVDLS